MNISSLALSLVSLMAVTAPQTAGAEVVVNPHMPGVYLLVHETFTATQDLAQSTERGGDTSTEHLECNKNTMDIVATVCTTRDTRLRIVHLTETDVPVFLLLFKDEAGTVNAAELTSLKATGEQHLATGESIRFFRPLEIQAFSHF